MGNEYSLLPELWNSSLARQFSFIIGSEHIVLLSQNSASPL